jgi:hypothetical protein
MAPSSVDFTQHGHQPAIPRLEAVCPGCASRLSRAAPITEACMAALRPGPYHAAAGPLTYMHGTLPAGIHNGALNHCADSTCCKSHGWMHVCVWPDQQCTPCLPQVCSDMEDFKWVVQQSKKALAAFLTKQGLPTDGITVSKDTAAHSGEAPAVRWCASKRCLFRRLATSAH